MVSHSTTFSFNVLILKKMLDKHFTISSEILFGSLSTSDTLSSKEAQELSSACSLSTNLHSSWTIDGGNQLYYKNGLI